MMRAQLKNIFLKVMGTLKKPKPGIHIINSHYVTPHRVEVNRDAEIFEGFLQYLNQFATFITIQEATKRILEKNFPDNEILIAFTFDDGFEECHSIIAPLLEKYNTRGAFFINANYIDCSEDYRESFIPKTSSKNKWPMTWFQIGDLKNRGHLIGSHTLDHENMISLSLDRLDYQVKQNKLLLERKLNYKCEYFAWPFGRFPHFGYRELDITMKYHSYIYSGTDYKNYFSFDNKVINRRHLEPFWEYKHLRYFLSTNKRKS